MKRAFGLIFALLIDDKKVIRNQALTKDRVMKSVQFLVSLVLLLTISLPIYAQGNQEDCDTCGDQQPNVANEVEKQLEPLQEVVMSPSQATQELIKAVKTLDYDKAILALNNKADVNTEVSLGNNEELSLLSFLLCENGSCDKKSERLKLMKLLLDNGFNPNSINSGGVTVGMEAALNLDADSIRLIFNPNNPIRAISNQLDENSLVEKYSGNHQTALMHIPRVSNPEEVELAINCVKAFKDSGVDLEDKSAKGETFFTLAVMESSNSDYILSLIPEGFNLNATTPQQKTPLMFAAKKGYGLDMLPAIKKMVDLGAQVNAVDETGKSVLDYAVDGDDQLVVEYLKEQGAVRGTGKDKPKWDLGF